MRAVVVLLLAALGAGLAFTACGGGDDSGGATSPAGGTAASGATTAPSKAAASTTSGGSTGSTAKLPTDGCALLTLDEAKKLSASMTAGKPGGPSSGQNQSVSCRWEWVDTTKTVAFGTLTVEVQTLPASVTAAAIKPALQAELRDAKENGSEVTGVGDYSIYTSVIAANGEAKGLVKGLLVIVEYSGADARTQKDNVIALFKLVAGRLQ
jgi:hypothetical protein